MATRIFWAILAAMVGLGASAGADDLEQSLRHCVNDDNSAAEDSVVAACTSLIQTNRLSSEDLARALDARGTAYESRGDHAHAMADFSQAIVSNPQFAEVFNDRGVAFENQGDHTHAIADYTHAIALNPQFWLAFDNRGNAYARQGKYPDAMADYDRAIALEPRDANAFDGRGLVRERQGDHAGAIAEFTRAIALDPQYAQPLYNRAVVYERQHDYTRALSDVDSAVSLAPENSTFQNERCWVRAVANRDLDVARAACDAALRLRPNDPGILDSRGFVGLRQERWQEAWNDYNAAATTTGSEASFFFGRGIAELRLGRTEQGQADLAHATQLNSTIAQTYAGYGVTP